MADINKRNLKSRKHVLITGGNQGIGLETTKAFIDLGYRVTVLARENTPYLKPLDCHFIKYDLNDIEGISKLISTLDHIDVLINNAGIMNVMNYNTYTKIAKNKVMKVNLEAPVELMTCVSKKMIKNKSGRIVNNASIAGQIGHPDIWYGITKAGIINATKSFAKILGPQGIIVNCIAAGPVETDMIHSIPESRKGALLSSVYSGRFAQASEVAKTIAWLGSESPAYINGVCIDINNGAFPR
ncbi:MAG: SDR family oxidoreductase [Flavobacteriales bacterium]|nr:SDR family oxidoreductase [Flavobacteriales bacterium]